MIKQQVTLIGTFRKDRVGLEKIFKILTTNFDLLSPKTILFADNTAEFVKTEDELNDSSNIIEERVFENPKTKLTLQI